MRHRTLRSCQPEVLKRSLCLRHAVSHPGFRSEQRGKPIAGAAGPDERSQGPLRECLVITAGRQERGHDGGIARTIAWLGGAMVVAKRRQAASRASISAVHQLTAALPARDCGAGTCAAAPQSAGGATQRGARRRPAGQPAEAGRVRRGASHATSHSQTKSPHRLREGFSIGSHAAVD